MYIDALNPERFWTAAQCHKAIRQLAAGFKAAGLSEGDCVSIHSFNDINYPVLVNGIAGFGMLSCHAAGLVSLRTGRRSVHWYKSRISVCSLSSYDRLFNLSRHRTYELVHHLKSSKAQLIVVAPELLNAITAAGREVGISDDRILIFDDRGKQGHESWKTLFDHGEIDWPRFNDLETSKKTVLARLFSSGTTGQSQSVQVYLGVILMVCQRTSESSST